MRNLIKDLKFDAKDINGKSIIMSKIMLATVCMIMCVMNITSNEIITAVITGGLSLLCIVNAIMYKKFHSLNVTSILTLGVIGIVLMHAVISGGTDGFSIVWMLMVPPLAIFFYKLLYGGGFSILLGIAMAIYLWSPLSELGYAYPEVYQIRFPIVYFFDTAISVFINYNILQYKKKQVSLLEMTKQASDTKSDFLANMSHEIRTPLNAVMGMCELILRENDLSNTVREYCFNIQNSGRSLLAIINDILDFSKIESGNMELIEEEFNISSTINDVINTAIARKGDKPLELIVRCDPDIPSGLIGDEVRIQQVMINLVTNAIKFTNSGCIVLKVTQTKHDYGINLTVSVADTGIGISPENIEKLFNSFSQVDTKKNRAVEGTGLGLAISRKFITRMGGFISVTSEYGSGSEFKFVIPLKVSDPKPFISVKDSKKIKAACFIDMSKYEMPRVAKEYTALISELSDTLDSELKMFNTFEELKAAEPEKNFTHIFIAREEYLASPDFFNSAADKTKVILVQDRTDEIEVPSGIKCIYKPFYTIAIASVLNDENILSNTNDRRSSAIQFTAPKARVLIVDDNIINLKVAVGLMRPYCMQILTADSGAAAIEMLKSKDFDIVFMDHMMPEMDGVEATHAIRAMEGSYYKNLPIIALTANAVNGVRDMYIEEGLNDFIPKPIDVSNLSRVLKNWLPRELIEMPSGDTNTPEISHKKPSAPEPAPVKKEAETAVKNEPSETELFNSETGAFYTGGDIEAYNDILGIYLSKAQEKHDYIKKLFEEKSWKNYIIEVHALKSTSLTIGSQPLSELAKELELAGKAENYSLIEQKNGAMLEMYMKVAELGRKYLEPFGTADNTEENAVTEDTAELTEITKEQIVGIIDRIKSACEAFDGDEVAAVCSEASEYSFGGTALKPFLSKIKSAADDFEYDGAAEKTAEMQEKLGI